MEIIGGNTYERRALASPGLDIWVDSRPHQGDDGGGDIHYFSMCGAGYVTRLALADIAGHGRSASDMAGTLRKLMRKHINQLDQTRFAREINREFGQATSAGRFATAVLATYFAPTDNLIVVNAGHPRPLWYSTRRDEWQLLDDSAHDDGESIREEKARYHFKAVANLPLGIIEPTDYSQFAVKLERGDLVILYTDALIEACDSAGTQLGEVGLLDRARTVQVTEPQEVAEHLLQAVDAWRGGVSAADDQTLIVLHHNAGDPPKMTLTQAIRTLAKMIGLSRV